MNEPPVTELSAWAENLEHAVQRLGVRIIDRVVVVRKTGTTQDLAALLAGSRPGLLLVAGQQSKGRGRLGRVWLDRKGLGLAATFALDPERFDQPSLPIAAGLAVCKALDSLLPRGARIGLRWPNDIVEVDRSGKPGRKIAGVLIERRGPLVLLGIGVNVSHQETDWPEILAAKAVSLAQLGSNADRLSVAHAVLEQLDHALHANVADMASEWRTRNVLEGRQTAWQVNGERVEGIVEHIDPASQITLKLNTGVTMKLQAAHASLLSVDGIEHQAL